MAPPCHGCRNGKSPRDGMTVVKHIREGGGSPSYEEIEQGSQPRGAQHDGTVASCRGYILNYSNIVY